MARRKRYNPERRTWRGRSYKRSKRVRALQQVSCDDFERALMEFLSAFAQARVHYD